jgi:hypothetical protein
MDIIEQIIAKLRPSYPRFADLSESELQTLASSDHELAVAADREYALRMKIMGLTPTQNIGVYTVKA